MAAFALDFLRHGLVPESELESVTTWYFIDAVFSPYAHDGRQYPPEDTRALVQRDAPLPDENREALERLGFSICGVDAQTDTVCDGAQHRGSQILLGLGERVQQSESRWTFDFGFGVIIPSGMSSTGAARISIRSHDGTWSLTATEVLWVDH
jgi:hypothetical protein